MTEAQWQRRVMDAARATGWLPFHFHDSRRQVKPGVFVGDRDAAGFPDLVLVHARLKRTLYRELKSDTGRLRPEQTFVLEELRLAGNDVAVWRPKDWPEVVATLAGKEAPAVVADPLPSAAGATPRPRRTP